MTMAFEDASPDLIANPANATLVCIYIQQNEVPPKQIIEVGIASLRLEAVRGVSRGPGCENWHRQIQASYIRVSHWKHVRDRLCCPGDPKDFETLGLGDSIWVDRESDLAAKMEQMVLAIRPSPPAHVRSTSAAHIASSDSAWEDLLSVHRPPEPQPLHSKPNDSAPLSEKESRGASPRSRLSHWSPGVGQRHADFVSGGSASAHHAPTPRRLLSPPRWSSPRRRAPRPFRTPSPPRWPSPRRRAPRSPSPTAPASRRWQAPPRQQPTFQQPTFQQPAPARLPQPVRPSDLNISKQQSSSRKRSAPDATPAAGNKRPRAEPGGLAPQPTARELLPLVCPDELKGQKCKEKLGCPGRYRLCKDFIHVSVNL